MSYAQNGTAIITLVMPPPGGDGYSALQSGASLPEGAASLYYNPALLAELERTTGSRTFYTQSRQDLLPILSLDIYQTFWAAAVVIPEPEKGTDVGIGFFRNYVSFGESIATDSNFNAIGTFQSDETVYGMGLAKRLGIPVGLGGTLKYFDSDLAHVVARGWAIDFGAEVNPCIAPTPKSRWAAITFTPSMAVTVRNLGRDVYYIDPKEADPIPTTYSLAFGSRLVGFDMIEIEGGMDFDQEWTARSRNWQPQRTLGYSCSFLGIRYSEGWLDDPLGKRWEKHTAGAFEFNFLKFNRCLRRFQLGDFTSPSQNMDPPAAKIWGVPFPANPRVVVGTRKIESSREGVRLGQKAFYFSLAL